MIVYLSVSIKATNAVLVLQDPKKRYQVMKKVALELVNVVHRLRQYFQSHKITVWTDCPIAKILRKPKLVG